MKESVLKEKSYAFAIRIVRLSQFLQIEKKEYTLSRQVLRSGTAIGALITESAFGESKSDFAHKLSISLKEAFETDYWLSLLKDTEYIDVRMYESISIDCVELIKMLISSLKTVKKIKSISPN